MSVPFKFRRNTAAGAEANNAVLADGEPGYDKTNKVLKVGDGSTPWNDLDAVGSGTLAPASDTSLWVCRSVLEVGAPSATSTLGANSAEFVKVFVDHQTQVSDVLFEVATQSGNLDVGIYAADGTGGAPGTRQGSSGSTACPAAGAASVSLSSPVTLDAGVYWVAIVFDNATAALRYYTGVKPIAASKIRYVKSSAFPLPASVTTPSENVTGTVFGVFAANL